MSSPSVPPLTVRRVCQNLHSSRPNPEITQNPSARKPERLVLRIGDHTRMGLEGQGELLLPARVQHDMADVAPRRLRARFPAGFRGDEIDVPRRALGIVGIEHRQQAASAGARAGDVDLLGRAHELVLIEDRADRHAFADEITLVEPAPGEPLDLREQMLLGETVLVAKARIEQMLGEVEADLGGAQPLQHLRRDGDARADDALHDDGRGPDVQRRDLQPAVRREDRFELVGREIAAITAHARKHDLQRRALFDGVDAGDGLRRRRLGDLRRAGEIERDAHDVGIFDVEQAGLGVEVIRLATQAAPDHLLAQKLGAEGADAEDVRHRVGVPAFGEHRDRHHAADLLAEPTDKSN